MNNELKKSNKNNQKFKIKNNQGEKMTYKQRIDGRGFDELRGGQRLRSGEIENDLVPELSNRDFRDPHFVDSVVEFVDSLFEIGLVGNDLVVCISKLDLDCFAAG